MTTEKGIMLTITFKNSIGEEKQFRNTYRTKEAAEETAKRFNEDFQIVNTRYQEVEWLFG